MKVKHFVPQGTKKIVDSRRKKITKFREFLNLQFKYYDIFRVKIFANYLFFLLAQIFRKNLFSRKALLSLAKKRFRNRKNCKFDRKIF